MERVKTNRRPDLLPTRCVTLAKPLPLLVLCCHEVRAVISEGHSSFDVL